jgi:hypothetical protein
VTVPFGAATGQLYVLISTGRAQMPSVARSNMTIKAPVVQVVMTRVLVAPTQVLIGAGDVTWKAST